MTPAAAPPETRLPLWRSLTGKLTFLVGLTFAVLVAGMLVGGYLFVRELLHNQIDEQLGAVAASRRDMVAGRISQLRQRAEMMAEHGQFRGLTHNLRVGKDDPTNWEYSQGRLDEMVDGRRMFSAFLADMQGNVLLASKTTVSPREVRNEPAFIAGTMAVHIGIPRQEGGKFVVDLSAPVFDYHRPPRHAAVLMMTADVSALAAAVRDTTGLGESGDVIQAVRQGDAARSLFPPRYRDEAAVVPLGSAPSIAAALAGRPFLGTASDYRGRRVLAASVPVGDSGWGLVAKMDEREAYAPIARAVRYGLLGCGIAAAAGLLVAYVLARGVTRPVRRLAQAAARVASGDYHSPVVTSSSDEIGVLAASFNHMTESIRTRIAEREAKEEQIRELNTSLEQRVIERTTQLGEANRDLESFSYSVSHDLRAPLRAVNGYARILLQGHGDRLDEEGRRLAEVIRSEGERMGRLIDALLEFSRLGRQALTMTSIDMGALALAAFDEAAAETPERQPALRLGELPPAQGDATLLRQVFANLFGNAVKFTRHVEHPLIEAGARTADGETVYWVRDNGAGFDPRYADQLFGVFQRLHSHDEFAGTGVGLAFVQRIIHRHSGRIWAEGKPGEGATFYFTLRPMESPAHAH